jgi:hypothetical protein
MTIERITNQSITAQRQTIAELDERLATVNSEI